MTRARAVSLLVMGACLAFGAWGAARIEIHSELGRLTPGEPKMAELSQVLAESLLARTWAVLIEGGTPEARKCVAREVRASLLKTGQVEAEPSTEEIDQAFFDLYFPRRNYFLTDDDNARRRLLSEEGLRQRLDALRRKLASPTGAFARKLAPEDPLLVFLGHLENMQRATAASLRRDEDLLVTEDGGAVALLMRTKFSAFDAQRSKRFETEVQQSHARATESCGAAAVRLSQSATHRFSWRTESMIRADIQRVTVFSTLGMVLLFLLVLPAGRALVGVFAPTLFGLSFAVGATALVFTRVHGMSVAFGAAMLGVCVDYAVHWVIHDFASDEHGAAQRASSARVVGRSILLGAGTTIAGLALLAGASFPGMRELSFFACAGVCGAAAATLWLLPPWIQGRPVPRTRQLAQKLQPLVDVMRAPRVGWSVVLLSVLMAAGLARAEWSSGLEALLDRDQTLLDEDEHVRSRIARFSAGRLVAVRGESAETVLRKLEAIQPVLSRLRKEGALDVAQSVHPYLWSKALQRRNLAALGEPQLEQRFARVAQDEGFSPGAFDWPTRPSAEPLTLGDLQTSALAAMVEPFVVEASGESWAFVFLGQGANLDALRAALSKHDVIVFDQRQFLADAFNAYRERVFVLGAAGLLVIFLVLLARYRNLRWSVAAFMPAFVASLATLGVLGWVGTEINILHLVALLLVLGIGVDYGVFVVEPFAHQRVGGEETVFLSIVTACATTTLSFGLLALSSYAPLRSMGSALMVGVPLSLLLAPLSSWLAARSA